MARTGRIKKEGDAHYHVMSRTNNRLFLFGKGRTKRRMAELLVRAAAFSGVTLEAYCLMDNHFHAVVHVTNPDEPVPECEVVRRIGILKGEDYAGMLADHWAEQRKSGLGMLADAQLNLWRRRMHDVSQFVKTYKELVNIAYKAETAHTGSIWSGRFTSTLVEDGRYLATCIRYVELNPVRAGIVRRVRDYAYGSHNSEKPLTCVPFAPFAGTVPAGGLAVEDGRLMRRIVQIGAGKLFGSRAFVGAMIEHYADRFPCERVVARHVAGETFASHGHRLVA